MNKNNYKKAFSQVRPSDEAIERIFEMTEKKNRKIKHKGLIVAIACLVALLCGTLTANAATDGALFDGIKLIVNGEEANLMDYLKVHRKYVTEDGKQVEEYEFVASDESGKEVQSFEFSDNSISAEGEFIPDEENNEDVKETDEIHISITSESTEE